MQCTSKGCGQSQAPYLDKDTNKVYCSKCNQEISNVSPFAKSQMKFQKQFRQKEKKPFAVACNHCKHEDRPLLINGKIMCVACKKEITGLNKFFENMLKEQLKNSGDDNI